MTGLLSLLQDAIGPKYLLPIVAIAIAAFVFLKVQDYPPRELLRDRWFLITVTAVVATTIGVQIHQSGLAERTPEGRIGIYIARFPGDPDRSLHSLLTEALIANLKPKAAEFQTRLVFRDLKRSITEEHVDRLDEEGTKLNATVLVWGQVERDGLLFLRIWSRTEGLSRKSTPLDLTRPDHLAEISSDVWRGMEASIVAENSSTAQKEEQHSAEIAALREEVAELRDLVTAALVTSTLTATLDIPSEVTAVMVGISYEDTGVSTLRGPPNDVAVLTETLGDRYPQAHFVSLLNQTATKETIRQTLLETADSMAPGEHLVVYLSGHSAKSEAGTDYFLPADVDAGQTDYNGLAIAELVEEIFSHHPTTTFLLDASFDPSGLTSKLPASGAILSAATSPAGVYEILWQGKNHGSFTAALIQVLTSMPRNRPIPVRELYARASRIVQERHAQSDPRFAGGSEAPPF